ncbi:GNAT family N-acetyltransferase [Methylobacterium aquaticum]|uniref:GNAT family N-acetyltransferase n=1 Tax=Methylobacterium aquaticum TaxID=270351 RepID=UPI000B2F0802|nr:GNAT family N-acetyltransferase [Methylobacterium aquaticum]
MSEVIVRRAGKPDLPAVLGLYAELNDGRVATLDQAEALLARLDAYPDYGLYVAEVEGRIVGTFCLVILDNIAHWGTPSALVESVVVGAAERGTGLGRRMMQEAGRLAAEKGCYKLALSSNVDAKPAHRFYESLGFERYGYSFRLDPPFAAETGLSEDGDAAASSSPRGRGDASSLPHPRSGFASPRFTPDEGGEALFPPAGRGDVPRLSRSSNSHATDVEETA